MNAEMVALTNFSFDGNGVRVFGTQYDPWFVGIDVATALGYKRPRNAISRYVDEDDSLKWGVTDALGRVQETILINESGMYALIFGSDLPEAKRFKRWVTHEVLPSIRKKGYYKAPKVAVQRRHTRGRPSLALTEHLERKQKYGFTNGEKCDITELRWISRELGMPLEQICDKRTGHMVDFVNEQMSARGIESISDIPRSILTCEDEPDETYTIVVDGVQMVLVK